VRLWLISLAGAMAGTTSSTARADELALQRLVGLASADVSANLKLSGTILPWRRPKLDDLVRPSLRHSMTEPRSER